MEIMQSMFDGVSRAFFLNPSTLSGSIDVIVVHQPDDTYTSTPFHVRFGRLHLLYSAEKVVTITVNGEPVPFNMKLGAAGEAFFVHEIKKLENEVEELATSPISEIPASPIPQSNVHKSDDILPSQAEQIIQEHPEAVAEMIGEDPEEKNWDWAWGWGTLPRIQSNESKDDINTSALNEELAEQVEEALVTVSADDDKNTMSKLLGIFSRGKPQYLSTSSDLKSSDDAHGASDDDINSNDVFFDMDDDNDDDEGVNDNNDPDEHISQFTTPTESASNSDDENEKKNEKLRKSDSSCAESPQYHTIFTPLRECEDSPISGRNELSRSLSGNEASPVMGRHSCDDILAQSLPAEHKIGDKVKESEVKKRKTRFSAQNVLDSLTKDSLLGSHSIEISLCAKKVFESYSMSLVTANQVFDKFCVTREMLSQDPSILTKTEDLAVRINNRIFPWKIAYPAFMSALLFDEPLGQETIQKLEKTEMEKQDNKRAWMSWLYPSRWRSTSVELPSFTQDESTQESEPREQPLERKAKLQNTPPRMPPSTNSGPISRTSNPGDKGRSKSTPHVPITKLKEEKQFRKSLRPTLEQIEQMKLKPGANSITFSVNTELRGTQTLVATVYLWEHDSKLVISDIDGTITRSDVFGHVLPMVGRDWSHSGVAKLFSLIRENGYHIVYLTSRAIGQAQTTRNFINNLRQDGDTFLPKGPVFMSPDRLFWAFNREIIRRKPEEFKIACLQDIARIFPSNPFYAGFGNRKTDLVAYQEAGVPSGRVFIINPSGNITTINKTYSKTYHNMAQLVNEMYPPTHEHTKGVNEDYNDWNYWKIPLPDLDELK